MTRHLADMADIEEPELCELDRLLNDPETPMQAARVWELLERVSSRQARRPDALSYR